MKTYISNFIFEIISIHKNQNLDEYFLSYKYLKFMMWIKQFIVFKIMSD